MGMVVGVQVGGCQFGQVVEGVAQCSELGEALRQHGAIGRQGHGPFRVSEGFLLVAGQPVQGFEDGYCVFDGGGFVV